MPLHSWDLIINVYITIAFISNVLIQAFNITRRSKIVSRATGRRAVMSVDHFWCGVVQKRNAKGTKFLVSNVASLLSFARVSSRGTLSLSANALLSLCPHFLLTGNSFDFCFDSSETFAKSFDSFAIFSSRNDPFRNICSLYTPSFRVGLPLTVCGVICLSVEKMTPFVFDLFVIDLDIVERRLRPYYVSAVFLIARDCDLR